MKQDANPDWIAKVFGSADAWKKSRPVAPAVRFGRRRHPAIHCTLLKDAGPTWTLPCPDRPLSAYAVEAATRCVTGVGPRPRLAYEVAGQRRIAIGRRGEPVDNLRQELVATYGLIPTVEVRRANDALAEYVATGGNYRPFARSLGVKDATFLRRAADPAEVEKATILSDRQLERVWRLQPVLVADSAGEASNDPAEDAPAEVTIVDPGGTPERPAPLPAAIPKADGRGRLAMYFGHQVEYGAGGRWREEDFVPPLRIALGGLLNRELGFGLSGGVDEVLPYAGDGYHWGRNLPLPPRFPLGREVGPVCRVLQHPPVRGDWYPWLATPFPVPDARRWETWQRRRATYDRQRKKSRLGSKAAL